MTFMKIVDDYIKKHRQNAEKELRWFNIQKTLTNAISLAAMAKKPSGKRFDHQRRIPEKVIKQAKKILLSNVKIVRRASDFDELYNIICNLVGNINGIGELYIYDTSLRIGAQLDFEPDKIYLHAGTMQGARKLGLNTKQGFIEVTDLPKEFSKLKAREIEDCLCIYKDQF